MDSFICLGLGHDARINVDPAELPLDSDSPLTYGQLAEPVLGTSSDDDQAGVLCILVGLLS
jgi:hypothetical protein